MAALLVLLRHGESQWNKENKFTGWVDVPLTEKGREEARRAGRHLSDLRFERAFTSKLRRAAETLDLALAENGDAAPPIDVDEALNERHYGDLQGLDKAETAKRYGDEQVHIWRRSFDVPPPGGESLKDTAARTLPYFERAIVPLLKQGKNVLVAAHGNSLRSIVMRLDELDERQIMELNIPTGVPLVYEIGDDMKVLSKRVLDG